MREVAAIFFNDFEFLVRNNVFVLNFHNILYAVKKSNQIFRRNGN